MREIDKTYVEKLIKKIFTQAENGEIQIESASQDVWKFYVNFSSTISKNQSNCGINLSVKNKQVFLSAIMNYLNQARKFYENDKEYFDLTDFGFDEKLVMDLIINATNYDLINIEQYVKKRTAMLLDKSIDCGKFFLGEYLGCDIVVQIVKNKSNLESPYKFSIFFERDNERFFVPSIYFSRIKDEINIYAIQAGKDKQINKLAKQLDRHFRKVNSGVDMEDEILSQVSPNALISLVVFLAYQKSTGVENIQAVNFMPIRYSSNANAGIRRLKLEQDQQEFLEKHDKNQFNISNRFLYTLIRYAYHFGLDYDFDDIHESLSMCLSGKKLIDNNIVHSLDEIIRNNILKQVEQ